ncbi:GNAT family N-acetyltransferase [Bacillus testis]|uniref:GNAT family N-acetyltransferase n=1 Tax=Bacillus testis TaxID=1622072 RepID=UPI00067F4398|nr:GNAT family N-acetyltransferase [Bacillus testis]
MSWHLKRFGELSREQLYSILQERVAVFVVEQSCPYPEIDGMDPECWHLFKEEGGTITAYLRIVPAGVKGEYASIGRVLVNASRRGSGLGRDLVARGMEICRKELGLTRIDIQAQAYLKDFYGSFGFEAVSDVYLEDGIPHLDMVWKRGRNA